MTSCRTNTQPNRSNVVGIFRMQIAFVWQNMLKLNEKANGLPVII